MTKKNFSAALLFFSIGIVTSQNLNTQYWDNGQQRSEGILLPETAGPALSDRAKITDLSRRDGQWTTWYQDGKLASQEFYTKGLQTGLWKTSFPSGKQSSEVNLESGKAIYWYESGKLHSEGIMNKGMIRNGIWKGYFENGKITYEGNYSAGDKNGNWTWYNEKGDKTLAEKYSQGKQTEELKGH